MKAIVGSITSTGSKQTPVRACEFDFCSEDAQVAYDAPKDHLRMWIGLQTGGISLVLDYEDAAAVKASIDKYLVTEPTKPVPPDKTEHRKL